ncbi:MAG: methylated-DNA--[protein]-cysteine S-methyltransferase [Candidatus Eisenbacteria bacterium]
MASPVGRLTVVANESALCAVYWSGEDHARLRVPRGRAGTPAVPEVLEQAETQLREYFAGVRTSFDLPLQMDGTEFQRRVWVALTRIPYGTTTTYAEIARRIGAPHACRAVGAANGRNPISIIVPCHRVIGAGGALTGFGGGLQAKAFLLEHEARIAGQQTLAFKGRA